MNKFGRSPATSLNPGSTVPAFPYDLQVIDVLILSVLVLSQHTSVFYSHRVNFIVFYCVLFISLKSPLGKWNKRMYVCQLFF